MIKKYTCLICFLLFFTSAAHAAGFSCTHEEYGPYNQLILHNTKLALLNDGHFELTEELSKMVDGNYNKWAVYKSYSLANDLKCVSSANDPIVVNCTGDQSYKNNWDNENPNSKNSFSVTAKLETNPYGDYKTYSFEIYSAKINQDDYNEIVGHFPKEINQYGSNYYNCSQFACDFGIRWTLSSTECKAL